jgi:hypothetical protein
MGDKLFISRTTKSQSSELKSIEAFDGKITRRIDLPDNTAEIHNGKCDDTGSAAMDYCGAISFPVYRREEILKSPLHLPVAMSFPGYAVGKCYDYVDGNKCVVVSSRDDTMWFAVDRGYCLVRRVRFTCPAYSTITSLSQLLICTDVVKVDDGLWLPKKVRWVNFVGGNQPRMLLGKIEKVIAVDVTELSVNSCTTEVFEPAIPPGCMVLDSTKGKAYMMPGRDEDLAAAMKAGVEIKDGRIESLPTPISGESEEQAP